MKQIKIKIGKHQYQVTLIALALGEGLVVVIKGGDKPHIGAVSVSLPGPSLKDPSKSTVTTSVFTRLGHKDDLIAKFTSEKIAKVLGKATVAVAGLHIDEATETEINQLICNANVAVENFISKFSSDSTYRQHLTYAHKRDST
jgi:hypothetical protein